MRVVAGVAGVAGKFELKFNLENKNVFLKNVWTNLEIPATPATSATPQLKCMIVNNFLV